MILHLCTCANRLTNELEKCNDETEKSCSGRNVEFATAPPASPEWSNLLHQASRSAKCIFNPTEVNPYLSIGNICTLVRLIAEHGECTLVRLVAEHGKYTLVSLIELSMENIH